MKVRFISSIIFMLFSSICLSQANYIIETIDPDARASFGEIRSIYQDSTGRIWIGIFGKGLAYYDGQKIKRHSIKDEGSFSDKAEVFHEADGNLYLNFKTSIKLFNPISQTITDSILLASDLEYSGNIYSILVYPNLDKVYALFKPDLDQGDASDTKFIILSSENGQPFTQIKDKIFKTNGPLIFKKILDGFLIKSENAIEHYDFNLKLKNKYLEEENLEVSLVSNNDIDIDEQGNIWFLGFKKQHGKAKFILNKIAPNSTPKEVASYPYEDKTLKEGEKPKSSLTIIGDEVNMNLNLKYTISSGKSEKLNFAGISLNHPYGGVSYNRYKDKNGTYWIGGNYGLAKILKQSNVFKSIPFISNRTMIEDENGLIYGGHKSQINIYDPKTNEVNHISSKNTNWYGGAIQDHFLYFDNKRFNLKTQEQQAVNFKSPERTVVLNKIMRNGELWKTAWFADEICIYDLPQVEVPKCTAIPPLKGLKIAINDLYQQPSDGSVWLGTFGKGVFRFAESGKLIGHYSTATTSELILNNNIVCSFLEDSKKNMWIGHGGGLSKVNSTLDKIEHFPINPKRPDFYIVYGILPEDDDRFLWVSTNQGIFRFDAEQGSFSDFPLHPFIMETEYNRTSYLKAKDGRMYFGSNTKGNIAFYPEDVVNFYKKIEDTPTKIIINSIKKYNPDTEQLEEENIFLQSLTSITLQPGERHFEIEFSTDDFRSQKNNYYSWYLEGYEDHWKTPQRQIIPIRYENLSPGTYYLKMSGGLTYNSIGQNLRTIKIIVRPPWYQTWWFYLLLGTALLFLLYRIYNYILNRRLERAESKRIKELDALKTQLYTNITHEFRTPLTVIMGMANNLQKNEKAKHLITQNSQHLLRMINQLLDHSKLQAGQLTLNNVQGDIIIYLKYLMESFFVTAKDKNIDLTFYSEEEELIMDFDEAKMQHIIYNLLSNALKFTEADGKVIFHVQKTEQPALKLKIIDNGIGISPEELPHIFDHFYQADNSNTRKGEGTGIGLSLTKELIELMKGNIQVSSKKEEGTTFEILLPITNIADAPETITGTENIQQAPDLTIENNLQNDNLPLLLIIEDNKDIVSYLKTILEKSYRIVAAENGKIGIEKAIELIPDIIISDVMMPQKDGYEVLEILKKDLRTSHVPIILLTAKAEHTAKIKGLRFGADAFLNKPFSKDELLIRVEKLIATRRQLQQVYSSQIELPENLRKEPVLENAFLNQLESIIIEHLNNPKFGVPELAKAVSMSQMQVYRKLKALTGKTPSQFIRSIRLNKGMELVKTTDLNISEIAYDVGFSDPNYFSRVFLNEFGHSPSDTRK